MHRFASLLSGLLFLVGALVIVVTGAVVWAYLMVLTAKTLGVVIGWVALFASIWAWTRFEQWLQVPWRMWHELWVYADRLIRSR